jgi:hypothetical protein
VISTVKGTNFVSDTMSYKILRGHSYDINLLNVHVPTGDKIDDVKDSFYEELEHVFKKFLEYHTKILLGDMNAKVGIENESLHEINSDNGVRMVNFATFKILKVKSTLALNLDVHK